jgi:DNA-binding response OmpR family regulator
MQATNAKAPYLSTSSDQCTVSGEHGLAVSRGRVLVVDDDLVLRRSVERLLQAKGYDVVTAEHGREAVTLTREHDFDVVLSDIAMPELDGIQLLRTLQGNAVDLPVVLITGEPAVTTAVQALEFGAFHYLTKPVDLQTLEEVVDKAASLHRMTMMKRRALELVQHSAAESARNLETTFERALDSLWLAYQPIVRAQDGTLFGHEALLRSASEALSNPGAVLDAAEKLDQLDVLGRRIRQPSHQRLARRGAVRSACAVVSARVASGARDHGAFVARQGRRPAVQGRASAGDRVPHRGR